MKKPEFFIIGAPKCGTTALCQYLENHPDIFITNPKEPHYFADDFPNMQYVKTLDEYLALYDSAESSVKLLGEGSVWNLYSEKAVKNIMEFDNKAKFIVMLRNPVDLVYSMHSQHQITLDENERDFKKAWELQDNRLKGLDLPPKCREPKLLQYRAFGKLGDQVEKLLKLVPKDQVHFIVFDDFASDTEKSYNAVLDFLNISSDNQTDFPRVNENKSHKNIVIAYFTQHPPKWLLNFVMSVKHKLDIKNIGILEKIRKLNRNTGKRITLSPEFRKELVLFFENDVKKLSSLINVDLHIWNK